MIDLNSLHRASAGDADAKVSVRKVWLREVHSELAELQRLRAKHALGDRIATIGDKLMGMAPKP